MKAARFFFMAVWMTLTSLSLAQSADLESAKAAGLIGEKRDGLIGFVVDNPPAALVTLIENVNRQRQARYEEIARENGVPVIEVAKLAYLRAVENTRSGHYVEDASGRWVRKP